MKISEKRKAGLKLKREGVAVAIDNYVNDYLRNQTYKNAVRLAGQLHVMADVCTYDEYWEEKMLDGKLNAELAMTRISQPTQ